LEFCGVVLRNAGINFYGTKRWDVEGLFGGINSTVLGVGGRWERVYFYDLFGGSGVVGAMMAPFCERVVYNELFKPTYEQFWKLKLGEHPVALDPDRYMGWGCEEVRAWQLAWEGDSGNDWLCLMYAFILSVYAYMGGSGSFITARGKGYTEDCLRVVRDRVRRFGLYSDYLARWRGVIDCFNLDYRCFGVDYFKGAFEAAYKGGSPGCFVVYLDPPYAGASRDANRRYGQSESFDYGGFWEYVWGLPAFCHVFVSGYRGDFGGVGGLEEVMVHHRGERRKFLDDDVLMRRISR